MSNRASALVLAVFVVSTPWDARCEPLPLPRLVEEAEVVAAPPLDLHILRLDIPHLTLAQEIIERNGGRLRIQLAVEGITVFEAAGLLADAGFTLRYPTPIMAVASAPAATFATEQRVLALQAEINRLSSQIAALRRMAGPDASNDPGQVAASQSLTKGTDFPTQPQTP